jgi:uncharacterized protein (TIGR02599 family)
MKTDLLVRPGAAAPRRRAKRSERSAFTVLELLVSMTILSLLMAMVLSMLSATQNGWRGVTSKASQFREARLAFETISRRLRQATLNAYWDYEFDDQNKPVKYIRQSELHYVSGPMSRIVSGADKRKFPTHGVFFQAPFGFSQDAELRDFNELLNAWGYFIEYGDDEDSVPPFLRGLVEPKYRFRLKEFRQPAEELRIYEDIDERRSGQTSDDNGWFSQEVVGSRAAAQKRVVADNIIALVITPMEPGTGSGQKIPQPFRSEFVTDYIYNSRDGIEVGRGNPNTPQPETLHVLPPLVRVTIIALDEVTFNRLDPTSSPPDVLPSGVFTNPEAYERDIERIKDEFDKERYAYQIYNTTFPMKAARWINSKD